MSGCIGSWKYFERGIEEGAGNPPFHEGFIHEVIEMLNRQISVLQVCNFSAWSSVRTIGKAIVPLIEINTLGTYSGFLSPIKAERVLL